MPNSSVIYTLGGIRSSSSDLEERSRDHFGGPDGELFSPERPSRRLSGAALLESFRRNAIKKWVWVRTAKFLKLKI